MKTIMKKAISVLMTVLLCFGTTCCLAEAVTEKTGETAVLTFSSFNGGGPEYNIEIEDPEIVKCTWSKEYDVSDYEMVPGAGYDVICTFTGLKSGSTKMTVRVSSPLMENSDDFYTVTVDEDLNVTLNQERVITGFEFSRNGEIFRDSYEIIMLMDGYSVSISGNEYQPVDESIIDALYEVVEKYDLYRWDGFDKTRSCVLDGEDFRFMISFSDGTSIQADGNNAFPENYFDAMSEMEHILEGIEKSEE